MSIQTGLQYQGTTQGRFSRTLSGTENGSVIAGGMYGGQSEEDWVTLTHERRHARKIRREQRNAERSKALPDTAKFVIGTLTAAAVLYLCMFFLALCL